jgi:superfamily II RNA helicase
MLSATIHSPERFAQWVEDAPHERCLKASDHGTQETQQKTQQEKQRKQVWICSSPTRVVPLHHFAFLVVPNGIYKKPTPPVANNHQTNLKTQSQTKNPQSKFPQQNRQQPQTQNQKNQKPTLTKEQEQELKNTTQKLLPLTPKELPQTHASIKKAIEYIRYTQTQITRPFVLNQLFKQLRDEEKLPAIAFVFSRKNVERCAQEITVPLLEDDSKVPYTTARDCEQIIRRLPNYQEFLKLPEYVTLVKLLEKGIGIHHSGMIPILREIVELQISQKKIKLLFATESFAIGLDCPIRTVVFTEIRKYDGTEERILMPHEYTQMAGRAGRRGIDTVGYVVHANNLFELPTKTEYQHLVSGANQTLESKFRISYELVLSLLSLNYPHAQTEETLAHFVKNSMLQNEIQKEYQGLETEYQLLLANPPLDTQENEKDLSEYLELKTLLPTLVNKRKKEVQKEMERIETEIPDLETKLQHFIQKKDWDKTKTKIETQMELNRQTISYQISHILDILFQRGMIQITSCLETEQETPQETQAWTLTEKGTLAAPMTEIHPLLFGQHLHQFKDLSTTEWVALLSCFAGMKKDDKSPGTNSTTTWGKQQHPEHENVLQLLDKLLMPTIRELQDEEVQRNLYTGTNYEEMGNPIITRFVMDWCGCESEEDCKWILQTKLPETVSLGDFTKAVLKIIAISKQLVSILENKPEWLEIVSSLSKVEGNVAKYVVSCQSLYV